MSAYTNAFVFLELGVFPIEYKIEQQNIIFKLHGTFVLSHQMFWEMKRLREMQVLHHKKNKEKFSSEARVCELFGADVWFVWATLRRSPQIDFIT